VSKKVGSIQDVENGKTSGDGTVSQAVKKITDMEDTQIEFTMHPQ
tara:strand:+ start:6724 stop:6858 length:135 start_codon:yes stop_codon:yes gene_type:complete